MDKTFKIAPVPVLAGVMVGDGGCSSSDRLVTHYIFLTSGNNLPCHCEP
jgi:hypothetical protein